MSTGKRKIKIKAGDEYATFLYHSYDQKIMPAFEFLSQEEILTILDFITYASASTHPVAGSNAQPIQRDDFAQPYATISKNTFAENQEKKMPFKTMLVIFSLVGAVVHVFIIIKLFLYLRKNT